LKAAETTLLLQKGVDAHPHPQTKKNGAYSGIDAWTL
jgi:hypothetical protein